MNFRERLSSARFVVFILITILACFLVGGVVVKANETTIDKIATIAVTGFFTVWGSIVTFYFTRQDRNKSKEIANV